MVWLHQIDRGQIKARLLRCWQEYIYSRGSWQEAEEQSSIILDDSRFHLEQDLNQAFLKNNSEAIWQLEPSNNGSNTGFGDLLQGYLFYGGPTTFAPITLSDSLVKAFSDVDLRKLNWITTIVGTDAETYYYPYKYKLYFTGSAPEEYTAVLRLAEQYLIRSEARAQQNDLSGSGGRSKYCSSQSRVIGYCIC